MREVEDEALPLPLEKCVDVPVPGKGEEVATQGGGVGETFILRETIVLGVSLEEREVEGEKVPFQEGRGEKEGL